jgi:hypothetical protein
MRWGLFVNFADRNAPSKKSYDDFLRPRPGRREPFKPSNSSEQAHLVALLDNRWMRKDTRRL